MKLSKGGKLPKGKIIDLVRLVGQNPTNELINSALVNCELDNVDELTLENCEALIWSVWYEMDVESELQEAFKKFDKDGNGYLDPTEFKNAMTSYGEALTDEEFDYMMQLVDLNKDGKIDYNGNYKERTCKKFFIN